MLIKVFLDSFSFCLATSVAILFFNIEFSESIKQINLLVILGVLFLFLFSIYNYGGYKKYIEFSQLNEITALLKGAITTIILSIIFLFIFKIEIPDFILTKSRIAFMLCITILPSFVRNIFQSKYSDNFANKENILIIGGGVIGKNFIEQLNNIKPRRFNIVGIIDDNIDIGTKIVGNDVIGGMSQLNTIINNNEIDRLIIAVRHIPQSTLNNVRSLLIDKPTKLFLIPSLESFVNNPSKLSEYSGLPIISEYSKVQSFYYKLIKRFLDASLSSIGLVVSFPIWILIILLIKVKSKGPIFFTQNRIGLNGKEFKIYKFRTMHISAEKYDHCPVDGNDARVTKIGKWLRKTSLDELPQLINIIKGEMSLVGPRPEMPFQVENYTAIEKRRWIVKPGLTGLWQITPHRKAEPCENPEFDYYYINNQSLTLDLVIIVMTCFFVFKTWTH